MYNLPCSSGRPKSATLDITFNIDKTPSSVVDVNRRLSLTFTPICFFAENKPPHPTRGKTSAEALHYFEAPTQKRQASAAIRSIGKRNASVSRSFLMRLQASLRRWRKRWDSNPRAGYPTTAFRVRAVMTSSIHFHTVSVSRMSVCVYCIGSANNLTRYTVIY